MMNKNNELDLLFQKLKNNWDNQELNINHKDIFLKKLIVNKKSNHNYFVPFAIAASLLFLIGIAFLYKSNDQPRNLEFASLQTRQTDSIFTVIIERELIKIKEKKTPQNEIIIRDALKQMKVFDADYFCIIQELKTDGENKSIILALIANLQTRISFLQNVMQQIDNNEKTKILSDENTI